MHSQFEYKIGYNHIRVEIINQRTKKPILDALIPLEEIYFQRFITKHIMLRTKSKVESKSEENQQFVQLEASFYLERSQIMKTVNSNLYKILKTIQRRSPAQVDIFNTSLTGNFQTYLNRLVSREFEILSQFLDEDSVKDIINESYNRVENSTYETVSLFDFKFLIKNLLKGIFGQNVIQNTLLNKLYGEFTKQEITQ